MRILPINPNTVSSSASNAQFVVLGSPEVANVPLAPVVDNKINKVLTDQVPGMWATLGMENDTAILWQGNLQFSGSGNDQSTGETLEQIKQLYQINDELNAADSIVTERFINFDNIQFPDFPQTFTKDTIPNLRLTVFLGPDEGALVFYEHYEGSYTNDANADIEYILPQATPGFTTDRDRLTYIFPILPRQKIIALGTGDTLGLAPGDLNKSFVIKVLTFKRNNDDGHPDEIMKNIVLKVNKGENDHKLLKFIYQKNEFYEVNNDDVVLDPNAKTLFLIHGTFSTTDKSYNGLLNLEYDNNTKSWLQKTMDTKGYLQVLAFDHPTIKEDAAANVAALKTILNGVSFANNPNIDIVTTSRGGLVGKYIACCLPDADNQLPVRRMATIACANGVGYFDTGAGIARFLSVWKEFAVSTGSELGGVILGFAQFSAEYFLSQPGCQQMTIGNPRLTNIISKNPSAANQSIRIQPIVGDWDASLVADDGFFKRLLERGLDLITKQCLGEQNDWVVGTEKQKIAPPAYSNPFIQVRSMHVKYLNSDYCPDHVHQKLWDFFGDAAPVTPPLA